jgi:hypothetical protein
MLLLSPKMLVSFFNATRRHVSENRNSIAVLLLHAYYNPWSTKFWIFLKIILMDRAGLIKLSYNSHSSSFNSCSGLAAESPEMRD